MSDKELFGISEQLEASHEKDHAADPGKMVGDLISRKVLLNAIKKLEKHAPTAQHLSAIFDCEDTIKAFPSAQPGTAKRIVGKSRDGMTLWYQCDMCNEPVDAKDNYCRGCGRRLTDG